MALSQLRTVFDGYMDSLKQAQIEAVEAQHRERLMGDQAACLREENSYLREQLDRKPDQSDELQELISIVRTYED